MKNTTPNKVPDLIDTDIDMLGLGTLPLPYLNVECLDMDVPFLDIELPELDLSASPTALAPSTQTSSPSITMPAGTGKSVRTSIRLPRSLVEAFKRRAITEGKPYQTLMVRALREWLVAAGKSGSV